MKAVLIAAFIVKEMPLTYLRWLVVAVVSYAGLTLLYAATRRADVVPDDAAETILTVGDATKFLEKNAKS